MRTRTIFGLLLLLIVLIAFGPALVAVGSEEVAELVFGCEVNLNYAVPCVIAGKDYGQTFYDLGFLIWYSYLSLPIGGVLFVIWAVAAVIALIAGRARKRKQAQSGGSC
jgi:TRAP-type C4-dicarboxylate transport system permease small subunit